MKDVESVTGNMGEGEAVTPAEEAGNIGTSDGMGLAADVGAEANVDGGEVATARTVERAAPPRDANSDPWQALVQVGTQFIAALAAANDPNAVAHPWIERNTTTGAQCIKMPLPSPETAKQLANALSALADGLRGRIA
jgi:hypothetical protein